jgi:hypothetical protein
MTFYPSSLLWYRDAVFSWRYKLKPKKSWRSRHNHRSWSIYRRFRDINFSRFSFIC